MHPEREIARNFWAWVARRAHGDSLGGLPWSEVIWSELVEEHNIALDLGEIPSREPADETHRAQHQEVFEEQYCEDSGLPAKGFPTVQDALYDYLLAHIQGADIDANYSVWLRAVALVLGDAVRTPAILTVGVAKDQYPVREEELTPHTMVIGDDWSILSRSTFHYAGRLSRRTIKLAKEETAMRERLRVQ